MHRTAIMLAAVVAAILAIQPASAEPSHGLAMHGTPKYAADFRHLDYANPNAPKGGTLRLAATGSFDTLNPYVIRGRAAAGASFLYETLMQRVWDEPFTLYGLIAESVEVPDDRSWVTFTLRPQARFSDGTPITVDDVIFSWETIRTQGRPNSRTTYNKVARVERPGPRQVKFIFAADEANRELPLLIAGFLPILSKAYWQDRDFAETTLEAPVTSGPYQIDRLDPSRGVTYRRNPDYWGRDLPVNAGHYNFDVIRYEYYRDGGVALEAFKADDYDFRYEFDATRWATQYDFPAANNGKVTREVIEHGIPSGLRGLAFNMRRPLFSDRRVRQALMLAFDFEWINANLLHDGFVRTAGLFDNSDLAPVGAPGGAELALLEPWRNALPAEVFGAPFRPPATDGSGNDRTHLRAASRLLAAAGWRVVDGKRVNATGAPFSFEILLLNPTNERIALAYKRGLERLGIEVRVRLVESAQYQALIEQFDFDMAFRRWGVTLSPGNEQQNYWSSRTADSPGSRNAAGVANPAVDALIAALVGAADRAALVAAARALDRVLMWNYYVVPLYHAEGFRIAYWDTLARPPTIPIYGTVMETFWAKN